ncbi:probable serine/threonine-protein kinase DDB_G0276461 [Chrysoperla carnea]|uniref:probable serine/threonine-protein kinase DDB_G0276461 n=1 Tax=Chrysoperla carnea TaxID=189513 RepID=UPI001D05EE5C|nr:probable serine/threonine-protein kinase DDB_G0276461 [Chrysoperla carnea]
MFDQDDDFNIDEDFLSTLSSDIVSSTPLSDGTNFVFRKSAVPSPEKTTIHFRNTVKHFPTNIFNNDEVTDDSFNLDSEDQQKPSSQGNKRTFSELINNENTNQSHINAKLKKFAFSPVKRPAESIIEILQNDKASNTSSNLDISQNKQNPTINQTNERNVEKKNEFNRITNTKLKQLTSSEQNIHINKPVVQHNSKPLVQKRKFPGPAGLLPEINSVKETTKLKLPDLEDETVSNITILVPICSQNSDNLFTKGPWQQMLNDYGRPTTDSLPGKYTISWLKSTANVRQLIQQKSPFLAAIIDSINDNFNVKLKDQTGEIDGVIEKEVWDSYGDVLNVGSVLVLRQVGVLTFSAKKHYLNITANTIVIIYSNNEENLTVDITKGLNYLNLLEFTNSINTIREQNQRNNFSKKSVNNLINKPSLTHCVNNSNNSSSNVIMQSNNLNTSSNFMPQFSKRKSFVSPFSNPNSIRSNTNGPETHQSSQQSSTSSVVTPTKKFNFAKSKLSPTNNSIQINQNTKVDENKEDNADIESIVSSTFNGIDADSFFDDF